MQHQLILSNIEKYIELNDKEIDFFKSLLVAFEIKPKQFLLQEGQIAFGTYFVNEGCLRMYNIDSNGVAHIYSFVPSDWWIGDLLSLHNNSGSNYFIDALLPTKGWIIPYKKRELLFKTIPKFERFFRILIEKHLVANQQRLLDNMSDTAEIRYLKFEKRYKTLVNKISQKQVAAYIGVTPEFLSKMKGQMAKKKI